MFSLSKLFLLFCIVCSVFQIPVFAVKRSYIVYLGSHAHCSELTETELDSVTKFHHEFLGSFLGSTEKAKDAILYSYQRHINAFAARLGEREAAEIAKHPNVVSVFLNQGKQLHTTHTWDFMLLEKNGVVHPSSIWKKARFGEDSIIANLDTGVWPESKSFSDEGYGPVPSRWKGFCQNNTKSEVPCNKKLIGARYFNKAFQEDYRARVGPVDPSFNTARDIMGHGTHTLSTAAGNFVPGANIFGAGNGTAKGGSPRARVAAYKVCDFAVNNNVSECYDADILAGFEGAIQDGVDVLSVSLGGNPVDYFYDGLSIGAFHAVKNGIVVVCSAGNAGPLRGSVTNVAPWILTVGASTIDREFQSNVSLGNGQSFKGASLTKPLPEDKFYPLINATSAKVPGACAGEAGFCSPGTLDPEKVKGKIVACLRGRNSRLEKSAVAAEAGAVGMILCNDESDGDIIIADPLYLPSSHISYNDGQAVLSYINNTKDPMAYIKISPSGTLGIRPAPSTANFSSIGPNSVTPEILKPDVTAPGVDIIASFSEAQSITEIDSDKRRSPFNVESGTSMACPHVTGLAGLLKTIYPGWSPAAIKSAIMTSARTRDNTANPMRQGNFEEATPFHYGSGHIRPNRAMDPGLVYDLTVNDYLDFLCALGYNQSTINLFSQGYKCSKSISLLDFNYPSIAVPQLSGSVTVTRKLKNVGTPGKYAVRIKQPYGFSISVKPSVLKFDKIGEEKSFKVSLKAKWEGAAKHYVFGGLTWTDGVHYVRSPIAVASA